MLHDGRKVMIDHLLASPALAAAVDLVGVDNSGLGDEARDEAAGRRIPGSHHAPLVASFRWG